MYNLCTYYIVMAKVYTSEAQSRRELVLIDVHLSLAGWEVGGLYREGSFEGRPINIYNPTYWLEQVYKWNSVADKLVNNIFGLFLCDYMHKVKKVNDCLTLSQ